MNLKDYCQPALISLILAAINVTFYLFSVMTKINGISSELNNYGLLFLVLKIGFALLWAYLLNRLCKWKPHGTKVAWFLVLLPFILFMMIILGISGGLTYVLIHDRNMNELNNKIQKQEENINEVREGYRNKNY